MPTIAEICSLDRIAILTTTEKNETLRALTQLIATADTIREPAELERAVFEREGLMSTGIGLGVAVPHVRLPSVTGMTMALGVCRAGIEYDAFDGGPVSILILIAAPEQAHREYLSLLAKIALVLKNDAVRTRIVNAATPREIYDIIKEY